MSDQQLTAERLAEIKSLLRYETSISFHSARAKESMLLLVAEVESQAAELDAVRAELDEALRQLSATGHGPDALDDLKQDVLSGDRAAGAPYLAARDAFVRQAEGGVS